MKKIIFFLSLVICCNANAELRYIESVLEPGWKIENYPGTGVVMWHTSSTCSNGALGFPTNATAADQNRFYATALAARVSGVNMFIYFDNQPGSCTIVSFGVI